MIHGNDLIRPGPRAFCIITSCAAPGDSESHYRIDQLVLHVQGPIERAVMKGFGVNILIVYVGSWDEGGMKETVFFLRREKCITRILAEGFMKGRFRHCKSWRKIPTEDQFPLR